jgi:hypothetical protein
MGSTWRRWRPRGIRCLRRWPSSSWTAATATIYASGSEADALRATSAFAAEEQAAPDRVRVQREGVDVYVARAPEGGELPATDFEDVVFTSEEEH